MYNLNIGLAQSAASAANSLLVESACTTPRTPEIVNSLIAMTNPLDYTFGEKAAAATGAGGGGPQAAHPSSDSNSSSSSPAESPVAGTTPSLLHTRSQLVKAGLKLSIEQKRKLQNDGEDLFDMDRCKRIKKHESESEEDRQKHENGLTPEDEERRRRRRERNKIAATKCRLKKRERTANLITESETLETQNIDMKKQLQELKSEQRNLLDMLSLHRPHCQHNIGPATREKLYRLPSINCVMEQHSYSRDYPGPQSNTLAAQSGTLAAQSGNLAPQNNLRPQSATGDSVDMYTRPGSVAVSNSLGYHSRPAPVFSKTPSIIIDDVSDDYPTHLLTNLDDDQITNVFFNAQCHNYGGSQNYANSSGIDNGCMA